MALYQVTILTGGPKRHEFATLSAVAAIINRKADELDVDRTRKETGVVHVKLRPTVRQVEKDFIDQIYEIENVQMVRRIGA